MKLAIDARELARTNLESLGRILLRQLPQINADEIILLSDVPICHPDVIVQPRISNVAWGRRNTGGIQALRYLKWVVQESKDCGADIIYQINHFAPFRAPGIKQVTVIHDLYPLSGIEPVSAIRKLGYMSMIWRSLSISDAIIAVSATTKTSIIKQFGAHYAKKIFVNPNGVELPSNSDPSSLENRIRGKYLLVLGRVCYWKGYDRILRLYPLIKAATGCKLVFAGRVDGKEAARDITSAIAKDDDIVWLDYVADEQREWLYANCEALLYASRYDGFGLPPLEAAIRGVKVIMSDIPVLREVTEGKGHYVDFDDIDTAAGNVVRILNEPNDITEQVLRQIALRTSWQANAQRLNDIISEVDHA